LPPYLCTANYMPGNCYSPHERGNRPNLSKVKRLPRTYLG
jgi:hypothetical protein